MGSPYDLVGPVLPQALRLARYQASAKLPQSVNDIQSENDTINQTPSREEERLLMSNAKIIMALEDWFSLGNKDRTSRTSKLSRAESVRFQRAVYRIWLMSVLFGPRRFSPTDDTDEYLRSRMGRLKESWKDQKSFLQQFSTPELFQIDLLARDLVFTAQWAVAVEGTGLRGTRDMYDWNGMFLFAGPHIILRCCEDATTDYLPIEYIDDDGPYTKFVQKALSEIFQERQVTAPAGRLGFVLDSINGEHDRCHHCGGTAVLPIQGLRVLPQLYNETNWDYLKGRVDQEFLVPGKLSCNLVEQPLVQALSGDWPKLLHEMFACKGDTYAEWSKEDWTCSECWYTFFWDNLWRWRLVEKKKAGESVKKDCKYGYDCEEQRYNHGLAHAKRFNHLCKPASNESE